MRGGEGGEGERSPHPSALLDPFQFSETQRMKWGAHTVDGRGRPSEDRWIAKEHSGDRALVAVFDGHSGLSTVVKTVDALPKSIMALWEKVGDDEAALREGLRQLFIEHDKALARAGPLSYRESGSTATVALVTSKSVILAHVGDSPGFVMDSTTGKIIQEIKNHEPTRADEYKRIMANGGTVTREEGDAPRVDGSLMVSRAFGDFSLKFQDPHTPEFNKDWTKDFRVTAEPDIIIVPRPASGLLAVMSDGLVESATESGPKATSDVANATFSLYKADPNLQSIVKRQIDNHISESAANPKDYDGDDLTLILMDISLPIPALPQVVQKGGIGATTRKMRGRRTKTGKKKLPKTFLI